MHDILHPRPWGIAASGDLYVTVPWDGLATEDITAALHRAYRKIKDRGLSLVTEQFFGREAYAEDLMAHRLAALAREGLRGGGVAFVQGLPTGPWPMCGAVLHAAPPDTVSVQHTDAGGVLVLRDHGEARELLMMEVTGMAGDNPSVTEQMRRIYAQAGQGLAQAGLGPQDVARTYFFLRDIDRDYEEFNAARTAYFRTHLPQGGPYPASTGIQGNSRHGDRVVLNLMAFQGFAVSDIPTRRQCEASAYGKLFSRGKVVTGPKGRRAYISGTASIDEAGDTIYVGDPEGQIRQTMTCVRELLGNAGMTFADVVHASVYLKHPGYRALFERLLGEAQMEDFPHISMVAHVCRQNLLFEMDLVAMVE